MSNHRFSWQFYAIRVGFAVGLTLLLYAILAFVGRTQPSGDVVTVYAYSDMLSAEVFDDFTKQTGIRVVVKHFEAIEELMTKLVFAQEEGIDIVAPTDSMVQVLRDASLLQKLARNKLPMVAEIDPRLLGHYYDRENAYSVPFSWSPVAIGYDKRVISMPPDQIGWDLIFGTVTPTGVVSPSVKYGPRVGTVCLGEDPWETLFLSAHYLYDSIENLTEEQIQGVVKLLRAQRAWLECYTNNLQYFLISEVCSAVVMPAAYMVMMQESYPWADFVIPQSGGAIFIAELAVPTTCKKPDLAHKVINYLLSASGGLACFGVHAYNPANKNAYAQLPEQVRTHPHLFPNDTVFKKLKIFHNQIPMKRVEQYWNEIKL